MRNNGDPNNSATKTDKPENEFSENWKKLANPPRKQIYISTETT